MGYRFELGHEQEFKVFVFTMSPTRYEGQIY